VAALAGIQLPIILSQGTLLVTQKRVTQRVVNRLRPPVDADIVVPGGTVSLVGTTSVRLNDLDHIQPSFSEVDFLVQECSKMLPVLEETRYIRAFAGVRPLVSLEASADDRSVSRGFVILDHESDGLSNFVTVTGGKLTTYRLMAEKTADLVCGRLGVTSPCLTRELPLSMNDENKWVVAGLSPQQWLQHKSTNDALLCECEMVPISAVRQIIDHLSAHGASVDLNAISLRSRLGKGPCQGAFCGLRAIAYLYETGEVEFDEGLDQMRSFLDRRWQGLRPVLWGAQLVQEQLQEAIHCGLLNLEL
jgi:glycerol-3-phosphate dehydrogenase